jgi:hypothetical protein
MTAHKEDIKKIQLVFFALVLQLLQLAGPIDIFQPHNTFT